MMRKIFFAFLLLCFVFANSQTKNINLKFNSSDFKQSKTEFVYNGTQTTLLINDNSNYFYKQNIGEPFLPFYKVMVSVPYGAEFTNVNITYNTANFASNIVVEPTQHLMPSSSIEEPERVKPKTEIYTNNANYPSNIVSFTGKIKMNRYAMFTFEVSPFIYNPVTKNLDITTDISININYTNTNVQPVGTDDGTFYNLVKSKVVNKNDVPELNNYRSPTNPDDVKYLIVTCNDLKDAFQPLADWKTKKGFPAEIVTTEDILANPNYDGATDYIKVKQCIYDYYQNKGTMYVLMGGNEQVGMPDFGAYVLTGGIEYYDVHSDIFYACFDDQFDWNYDGNNKIGERTTFLGGDHADFAQDVFIARVPAGNPTEVSNFITKLFNYERTPATSNFAMNIAMGGAQLTETQGGVTDAELKSDYLYDEYINPNWGGNNLTKLFDAAGSPAYLNSLMNAGCNYLHIASHGYTNVWSVGGGSYYGYQIDDLTNAAKPTNIVTMACLSNGWDMDASGSLSEDFICKPNGAVSYYGSIREGWLYTGYSTTFGPSLQMNRDFYLAHFAPATYTINDEQKYRLGPLQAISKLSFIDSQDWLTKTLNMMGDPSMDMHTADPTPFTNITCDPIPIGNSSPITVHTGVPYSLVCLMKANDVYEYGFADASGNFICTPSPTTSGNIDLTVTAHNKVAYESVITIGAGADNDAAITSIIEPQSQYACGATTITPQVEIKNMGQNTLTSAIIKYQLNSETIVTQYWTGSLPTMGTEIVTLTDVSLPLGSNIFTVYTEQPNGVNDETPSNDQEQISIDVSVITVNADFTASPLTATIGQDIQFNDISTGSPIDWAWNFGDGQTSDIQNPTHQYTAEGTYTIELTSTNACSSSDTETKQDYITIEVISDYLMPTTGNTTVTECSGTLFDSGGNTGQYSNDENGTFTISPTGATSVTITFNSFDVEAGGFGSCTLDKFNVYDGNSTSASLIGTYCNNNQPPSSIQSTGSSLTIEFISDMAGLKDGFEIGWICNSSSLNNDATLSDLTSNGATVTGFNSATYTYNIELPAGTTTVPTVTATPTDANANAVITYASSIPGTTTIVVTAEDGTTQLTYSIVYDIATTIISTNNIEFVVYPNPASTYVQIESNKYLIESIQILDITGKIVLNVIASEAKQSKSVDISTLQSGIYFIKVGAQVHKFIKK